VERQTVRTKLLLRNHKYPARFIHRDVEAPGFQRYQSLDNKLDPSGDSCGSLTGPGSTCKPSRFPLPPCNCKGVRYGAKTCYAGKIDSLELNGRTRSGLLHLSRRGGSTLAICLNFGLRRDRPNFNGSRNPENLITFDGAPATRRAPMAPAWGRRTDSTQEVRSYFDYARNTAARPATNSLHHKNGTNQFTALLMSIFANRASTRILGRATRTPTASLRTPRRCTTTSSIISAALRSSRANSSTSKSNRCFLYYERNG